MSRSKSNTENGSFARFLAAALEPVPVDADPAMTMAEEMASTPDASLLRILAMMLRDRGLEGQPEHMIVTQLLRRATAQGSKRHG
jgi:hypothetical protein